jgi:hypothetical protein
MNCFSGPNAARIEVGNRHFLFNRTLQVHLDLVMIRIVKARCAKVERLKTRGESRFIRWSKLRLNAAVTPAVIIRLKNVIGFRKSKPTKK